MSDDVIDNGADAAAYAENVVRQSGTSFFWAMRRLPKAKRDAMYAVYAFCREVDDIADDEGEQEGKLKRLKSWRDEIDSLYGEGNPGSPITVALIAPVARFHLHKRDFIAMIEGMEMDAADSLRITNMEQLRLYCDQVACAVGRMSNRIFGIDEQNGDKIAYALGQALQLTNILSDLLEDGERNRLYLPADLLRAHGINATEPDMVLGHKSIGGVCDKLAVIASEHFAAADDMLDNCDRRIMRPAIMMMQVYRRILQRLQHRGWHPPCGPVRLPKLQKLWIAARYGTF